MCIVHRVISDPSSNLKAIIRFEFPAKKGITLSTHEIVRMTLGLSRPVDHVYTGAEAQASVAERVRRQDRLRLVVGESFSPIPEEQRSPQKNSEREPFRPPVSSLRSGFMFIQRGDIYVMMPAPANGTRDQCNRHNRGRKPEYKDKRLRAAGSGKARLEASTSR